MQWTASQTQTNASRLRWRRPLVVAVALAVLSGLLTAITAGPAAAAPGDAVTIFDPECIGGTGEVLFQVNNDGDTQTELNLSVGPYTRDVTVPAKSALAFPINGIADGTYQARAIFFISVVAERNVIIDCEPDIPPPTTPPPPLAPPTVTATKSGTSINATWNQPTGAQTYDYRITANNNRFAGATNRTTRTATAQLGTRSGEICVHVIAKATGRTSSTEAKDCITVAAPPPRLTAPTVTISPNGLTLSASWNQPSGTETFDYYVTRGGVEIPNSRRTNTTRRSFFLPTNNTSGTYCVYVTGKGTGRSNSPAGRDCRYFTAPAPVGTPTVSLNPEGVHLVGRWNLPEHASRFDYRMTRNGVNIPAGTVNNTGARLAIVPVSGNATYCIYVTGTATGRPDSAEGSKCRYFVEPTALPQPSLGASVSQSQLTVTWPTPNGARYYSYRTTVDGVASTSSSTYYGNSLTISGKTGNICVHVKARASGRLDSAESRICRVVEGRISIPSVQMSQSGSTLNISWTKPDGATRFNYSTTRDGAPLPGGSATGSTARSLQLELEPGTAYFCANVVATGPERADSLRFRTCRTLTVYQVLDEPNPFISVQGDQFRIVWTRVDDAETYYWKVTAEGTRIGAKFGDTCCGDWVPIEEAGGDICVEVAAYADGIRPSSFAKKCIYHRQALATPTMSVASPTIDPGDLARFQWSPNSKARSHTVRITRNDQAFTTRTSYTSYYNYRPTSDGVYCAYVIANPRETYHLRSRESQPPGCVTVNSQPVPRPSFVSVSVEDDGIALQWGRVTGADNYSWQATIGANNSFLAEDPDADCCEAVIPVSDTRSGQVCVSVRAMAANREASTAVTSCVTLKARIAPSPLSSDAVEVEQNQVIQVTWPGRTNVSSFRLRIVRPSAGTVTYPVSGQSTSFRLQLRQVGEYCMYLSAQPTDTVRYRESVESDPVCVDSLAPPTNEAEELARQYGGSLWGDDARAGQIILDAGSASAVRNGGGFGGALFAAAVDRGMRGTDLAQVMAMDGSSYTATEVGTIVDAITAGAAPISIDALRALDESQLNRTDIFDLLISSGRETVLDRSAGHLGTNAMSAFIGAAAASLEAANVSYARYLELLVPLGYMNGHQHFADSGVSGPDILNGVGLVFGGGSTAYTFRSANASKTLGGLGLAVGGYTLIADVANGGFDGDLADGASLLSLFATGAALVSGPVGSLIFGIISVFASLASFFLSEPEQPTFNTPVQDVLAFQREYAEAKAREDADRAARMASLNAVYDELQRRMSFALSVYGRGGSGLSGHADSNEPIYVSRQGQTYRLGTRYIFTETDQRSGRKYRATISDQGFSTDGIFVSLGVDLQTALGLVNVRDCPFGIWDTQRRNECS